VAKKTARLRTERSLKWDISPILGISHCYKDGREGKSAAEKGSFPFPSTVLWDGILFLKEKARLKTDAEIVGIVLMPNVK